MLCIVLIGSSRTISTKKQVILSCIAALLLFMPVSSALPNNSTQVSLFCDASPAIHFSGGRAHSSLEQWKIYTFFNVWFDFHSSWCSLRKQWMLCFQEMAALEPKAMVLSGKHSYGPVMMLPACKSIMCTGKRSSFRHHKKKAQDAATNVNIWSK